MSSGQAGDAGTGTTAPRTGLSQSLVGVLAAAMGLAVLLGMHYGPGLLAPDPGVARLRPVLFQPEKSIRGVVDLPDDVRAAVFLSGLRVYVGETTPWKSTEEAAPLMVLSGRVAAEGERRVEELTTRQRSLTVDDVRSTNDAVTWSGTALLEDGREVGVSFSVRATGANAFTVSATAEVPVDGFAFTLDPTFVDLVPPDRDGELTRAWWAEPDPVLSNPRLDQPWRLRISGGQAAVDARTQGSTILHIWGPEPVLTFTAPTVGS